MENVMSNLLRYPENTGMLAKCAAQGIGMDRPSVQAQYTTEQIEEMQKAENARQLEYCRRNIACAVVDVAEGLVKTHGFTVANAFETAKELLAASKDFVANFKLPAE